MGVLVLNKTDLVPHDVVIQWLQHLRGSHPTVAFQSMRVVMERNSRNPAKVGKKGYEEVEKTISGIGHKGLITLLRNYKRKKRNPGPLAVGLIGCPNVGKSSIINSLKNEKNVCYVSSVPGHTEEMQVVAVDADIQLLDCPGLIIRPDVDSCPEENVLRNTLNVELLDNPTTAVRCLMMKVPKETLMLHYYIPDYEDLNTDDFLLKVAQRRGYMAKRGIFDRRKAARLVLDDWNNGGLMHCVMPPTSSHSHLNLEADAVFMGNAAQRRPKLIQPTAHHTQETAKLSQMEQSMRDDELVDVP